MREKGGRVEGTEGHMTKPKDQREKKIQEIEAKSLGMKIYAAESNKFSPKLTYEEIFRLCIM